nr:VanZ family protein [Paenibacillus sp. NEAU-GSW1]
MLTFTFYTLAVLHLVFFPIEVNIGQFANQTPWYKSINFIPVLTIDIKTFIYNIMMLTPLGMYLPLLSNKFNSTLSAAKFSLCMSLSFEALQLVIRILLGNGRSTDINDIIANTIGGVVGFLAYKLLIKAKPIKLLADRSH